MADAQAQPADVVAKEKARQAALARAQAPPAEAPPVDLGKVNAALRAFNAAVHQVPDYMHIQSSHILDALQILDRVLKDLIAHDGKSPKDPSKQVFHP